MKRSKISLRWKAGLHLRPAAKLVAHALAFQSSVSLRVNERLADARSIFAVLLLAATCGSVIDLEVTGVDEDDAIAAITAFFDSDSLEFDGEIESSPLETDRKRHRLES